MEPNEDRVEPAHHFVSAQQQRRTAQFGMWMFLVSEAMIFGGLFAGYAVYWNMYPEAFGESARMLSVPYGTAMTGVLLVSSTTVAMAMTAMELDRRRLAAALLAATVALGLAFFAIKIVEYGEKIADGLLPGRAFEYEGPADAEQVELFYSWYFMITGTHALHLVVGLGALLWVIPSILRGRYHAGYFSPVEGVGLYWHLVDVIWIFVFPMIYLMGREGAL